MQDTGGVMETAELTTAEIWRCSNREYHADVSRIGCSMLKTFRRSPKRFHEQYILGNIKTEQSDAMVLGSMVHALLLEPETFDGEFVAAPKCDRRTTDGKARYAEFLDASIGKQVVDAAEYDKARRIADAVRADSWASMLLDLDGESEFSIAWRDENTGILGKARLDRCCRSASTILDIKTCRASDPESFAKQSASLGYYRQPAWYGDGYESLFDERPAFVFIAVETEYPFEVGCHEADDDQIRLGREQNARDLAGIAECRRTGNWLPKWRQQVNKLSLPKYAYYEDYTQ